MTVRDFVQIVCVTLLAGNGALMAYRAWALPSWGGFLRQLAAFQWAAAAAMLAPRLGWGGFEGFFWGMAAFLAVPLGALHRLVRGQARRARVAFGLFGAGFCLLAILITGPNGVSVKTNAVVMFASLFLYVWGLTELSRARGAHHYALQGLLFAMLACAFRAVELFAPSWALAGWLALTALVFCAGSFSLSLLQPPISGEERRKSEAEPVLSAASGLFKQLNRLLEDRELNRLFFTSGLFAVAEALESAAPVTVAAIAARREEAEGGDYGLWREGQWGSFSFSDAWLAKIGAAAGPLRLTGEEGLGELANLRPAAALYAVPTPLMGELEGFLIFSCLREDGLTAPELRLISFLTHVACVYLSYLFARRDREGAQWLDPYTGLLNYAAIEESLRMAARRADMNAGRFLIAAVRIDGYDRLAGETGFEAARRALAAIAGGLVADYGDRVGCLGDGIFCVAPEDEDDRGRVLEGLMRSFDIAMDRGGLKGLATSSAFYASYPYDGLDPATTLRRVWAAAKGRRGTALTVDIGDEGADDQFSEALA